MKLSVWSPLVTPSPLPERGKAAAVGTPLYMHPQFMQGSVITLCTRISLMTQASKSHDHTQNTLILSLAGVYIDLEQSYLLPNIARNPIACLELGVCHWPDNQLIPTSLPAVPFFPFSPYS